MTRIQIIDSHTAGEPTRVVLSGAPDLGNGSLRERLEHFRREHDNFRSAIINEPRGSDVIVGALLCEPSDPSCSAGVIFFNNIGYLGMCGHGTIGLIVTLAHFGRIGAGEHLIDTPVGIVRARLNANGSVTIENVRSYRAIHNLEVDVPGLGRIRGDVAWGGNWFFLTGGHQEQIDRGNLARLSNLAHRIRAALQQDGVTGSDGHPIDHIELFGPARDARNDSSNFVLCPGGAYDRSPCGTGTSAKMACLASDGVLKEGEIWRQESVIGSVFEASFRDTHDGAIVPVITGDAYVTSEATLILDPRDPFCMGLP